MKLNHLLAWLLLTACYIHAGEMPITLAPPESLSPRVNGPSVFGVRPGSDFLYTIPATGERPMQFGVDGLGRQAVCVATYGPVDIYLKDLEDGSIALGFFNRGEELENANFNKLGLGGSYHVRDLWRQQNLKGVEGDLHVSVHPGGVVLFKLTKIH